MCLLISTTSHPDYPLILLSNRDEYLVRPTKRASYRDLPNGFKILSPLDLARPEHGTWIGVTTEGKIAVLLNYREADSTTQMGKTSRGILPIDYLSTDKLDEEWYDTLNKQDIEKIGGFTLIYGKLTINSDSKRINHLNILSNRGDHGKVFLNHVEADDLHGEISQKSTFGLSNSLYYNPWKKVKLGESLLKEIVDTSVKEEWSKSSIVDACFDILKKRDYSDEIKPSDTWETKAKELQNSIFIPPIATGERNTSPVMGEFYGTRTHTVIILDKYGMVSYYEQDLHCEDSPIQKRKDQEFSFRISLNYSDGKFKNNILNLKNDQNKSRQNQSRL